MNDLLPRDHLFSCVDVRVHLHVHLHLTHDYEVPMPRKKDFRDLMILNNLFQGIGVGKLFRYVQMESNETSHHQKVFQQPAR